MEILVSFSGGKDSQAALIKSVERYGNDNITAVFCDTGWEHPETYMHIRYVCELLCVKLVELKSKFDFLSLAKYKKRFPSTKARFCTEELKVKPMIDYILSLNDNCIIIQGIRSSESISRAQMDEECMYFKYYFEPIEINSTRLTKLENRLQKCKETEKRKKIQERLKKIKTRLADGKEDPKFYTYRKNDVFDFCKKYDASVVRPVKNFSAQEVINIIINAGQNPNPLYKRGCSRVGCFPCMMCKQREVLIVKNDLPMKKRLLEAEKDVCSSFFSPSYIPKRYATNGKYPSVEDVFQYLEYKNATLDMFEPEEGYSCMSLFNGLCE